MRRHIIYYIYATILLASAIWLTSCASQKHYQEHVEAASETVSHTHTAEKTMQLDSIISSVSASADSVEIVIEPYLVASSDSIGRKITVKIHNPNIRKTTEKNCSTQSSVTRADDVITASSETNDITADAQLKQDTGATSVMMFIVIGLVVVAIIAVIILVRRFL